MFDLRLGGMGVLASASLLLAAPAWPGGCEGVGPGAGGAAGVGGTPSTCGDGQRQDPEQCDGTSPGGYLCTDFDYVGGSLKCDSACRWDYSGCSTASVCGNGVLEQGEQCDGDDVDPAHGCPWPTIGGRVACDSQCKSDPSPCYLPVCGNGVIENGETCDGDDLGPTWNETPLCSDIYFAPSVLGVPTNYTGGRVKCTGCSIDRSECTIPPGCYLVGPGRLGPGVACF